MKKRRKNLFILITAVFACILIGCGSAAVKIPDCEELYRTMEASGVLPEMVRRDASLVYDYYGIEPEKCAQLVNYVTTDGLLADEVLLIETKDASYAEEVYRMLEEQSARQAETFREYLPEEYEKISGGKLERHGTFVLMLVSEDVATLYGCYEKAAR